MPPIGEKNFTGGIMRFSLAKKILNIADELDDLGFYVEASELTNIVRVAQMPGGANPAAGYAQPVAQPAPPQTQIQPQAQPQQNWQKEIDKLTGGIPVPGSISNYPTMSPTTYYGPQTQYAPGYEQSPNKGFQGWYGQQSAGRPAYDAQAFQNQMMNTQVSPLTVVKDGVVQKGATMQDYMNNYVKSIQNKNQGQSTDNTVNNARQLQIQQEMSEAQEKYWKLWQEQQNQSAGDGHPGLYK